MIVGRASALLADHPDWVVREEETGEPVFAGDVLGGEATALDLTHPAAAGYLTDVLTTMRDWGIGYFKIDFVYAGASEGSRCQPVTGVEAYRQGLGLIREAIGPEAILLGCGAPILPSVRLVDAMRVGPDIAACYEPPDGHPSLPSQRNATRKPGCPRPDGSAPARPDGHLPAPAAAGSPGTAVEPGAHRNCPGTLFWPSPAAAPSQPTACSPSARSRSFGSSSTSNPRASQSES